MYTQGESAERARELLFADARSAGLLPPVNPHALGITLESADEFLARMRANERPSNNVIHLASRRKKRRLPHMVAAAAAASIVAVSLSVAQPWATSTASADTPAVLDFEFANAKKISYAPGEDPTTALLQLAKTAKADKTDYGTGPSQHVVTENWFTNTDELDAVTLIPQVNEVQVNADGSRSLVEHRGEPLAADGRGAPTSGLWDSLPVKGKDEQPAKTVDADFAASLSSSTSALRSALLKEAECADTNPGEARSMCLYFEVGDLFANYVVSPKLASALWTMLSEEEAFRLLGNVKDRAGRDGVGISIVEKATLTQRYVLIVSPKTGQLIGQEQILIKETPTLDLEAPAIMSFTAYLDSSFTAAP
ncbi:hypothetical protein BH09ACT10_BH09ACT10_03780 [soil metagenome]